MDRERLNEWLTSRHRTWRWNLGDRSRYDAVETRDEGLYFYRWAHVFGDVHGEHDAALQPWEAYRVDGPLRPLPAEVQAELDAWIEERRADENGSG